VRSARNSSRTFRPSAPAEMQAVCGAFVITRLGFVVIVGLGRHERVFGSAGPAPSWLSRFASLLRPSRWRAWPGAPRSAVYRSRSKSCGRSGLPSAGLLRSGDGERLVHRPDACGAFFSLGALPGCMTGVGTAGAFRGTVPSICTVDDSNRRACLQWLRGVCPGWPSAGGFVRGLPPGRSGHRALRASSAPVCHL
jgi:hypothetical protein